MECRSTLKQRDNKGRSDLDSKIHALTASKVLPPAVSKKAGVVKGEHVVRSILQTAGSERKIIVEGSVYVYEINESRVSESLSPVIPRR